MNARKMWMLPVMLVLFSLAASAQEKTGTFIPAMFWGTNIDKSILLTTPKEMEVIDTKGIKYGKITTADPVTSAYISPDGNKMVYTTSTGLWLVKLETRETSLIASGNCDYLHWSSDGSSFMFTSFEKNEKGGSNAYNIKLFLADGDGKNLKQVYPQQLGNVSGVRFAGGSAFKYGSISTSANNTHGWINDNPAGRCVAGAVRS